MENLLTHERGRPQATASRDNLPTPYKSYGRSHARPPDRGEKSATGGEPARQGGLSAGPVAVARERGEWRGGPDAARRDVLIRFFLAQLFQLLLEALAED